ncbi:transient receptor potential protein-like [Liolophura sinensis]|uniref:transient receptor potential protein-like n=1 Tax=Liolophura sinensis TaxID=3198878 RepID=UPI00315874B6
MSQVEEGLTFITEGGLSPDPNSNGVENYGTEERQDRRSTPDKRDDVKPPETENRSRMLPVETVELLPTEITIDHTSPVAGEAVETLPVESVDSLPAESVDNLPAESVDNRPTDSANDTSEESGDNRPGEIIESHSSDPVNDRPDENMPDESIDKLPVDNSDSRPGDNTDTRPAEDVDSLPNDTVDNLPVDSVDHLPADDGDDTQKIKPITLWPNEKYSTEYPFLPDFIVRLYTEEYDVAGTRKSGNKLSMRHRCRSTPNTSDLAKMEREFVNDAIITEKKRTKYKDIIPPYDASRDKNARAYFMRQDVKHLLGVTRSAR